ncbi:uncharacterized protein LOC129601112 [Paramacrobiotus metropolitanus]|uniref:uncharacterized protein LOC129601112 n=1 Tax=Paramacrobiotus metropolitanus TaxID=2943436 RepID=UPI0024461EC5|nr:uncharacterized protein LOC129601112 [Paramacrobiotus metropolitanus]
MTFLDALQVVPCLVLIFPGTITCPVQQGMSREAINGLLDNAIRNANNGIIDLNALSVKRSEEIRPADSIIRSPEGETARLHCKGRAPVPAGQEEKPQFWFNGRRKHSGASERIPVEVHRCSCLGDSNTTRFSAEYEIAESNPVTGELIVDILAFSHAQAGEYECIQFNDSPFRTIQTFFASPTVTPSRVFQPPMPNVTVRMGDTARFQCYVKFIAMPGDFGDRFLWRNEDHVIYADGLKELQTGSSTLSNFRSTVYVGTDGFCHCHSTLEISSVQANHAGRYQCWFKVDDVFHEWIAQESYLIVAT